jgi:hypothetical protein
MAAALADDTQELEHLLLCVKARFTAQFIVDRFLSVPPVLCSALGCR